jgi:hypothetical protein
VPVPSIVRPARWIGSIVVGAALVLTACVVVSDTSAASTLSGDKTSTAGSSCTSILETLGSP